MQEKCESCEEEKKINSVMRIDGELKGVCDDCLMMRIKKMD
jgi:hypothetical protein